jgi:phosphoserine phosphatase RsbU/P
VIPRTERTHPMIPASARSPVEAEDVHRIRVRRDDYSFLPDTVAWLKRAAHVLGIPSATADELDFCAEELLANIASYAYDDDGTHEAVLRIARSRDAVFLTFEDDGRGFDPVTDTIYVPPDTLDHAGHRGYGLHLVRRFADAMRYHREHGRNIVTVEKRWSP